MGNIFNKNLHRWANVCVTKKLLDELLPGPVTVVFERKTTLNTRFNPQTSLLGLRVPDDEFIRGVCSQLSGPLALTSANVSNHESALKIEVVIEQQRILLFKCFILITW